MCSRPFRAAEPREAGRETIERRRQALMAIEGTHTRRVRQAELIISHVLRGGVVLSAAIIGVGMLGVVLHLGNQTSSALELDSLRSVWQGILAGSPVAVIMAGLLVLLVTPVVRVAVSVVA